MVWAHKPVGGTWAADGREKATGLANEALPLIIAGELKVFTLLLSDALQGIVDSQDKHARSTLNSIVIIICCIFSY